MTLFLCGKGTHGLIWMAMHPHCGRSRGASRCPVDSADLGAGQYRLRLRGHTLSSLNIHRVFKSLSEGGREGGTERGIEGEAERERIEKEFSYGS